MHAHIQTTQNSSPISSSRLITRLLPPLALPDARGYAGRRYIHEGLCSTTCRVLEVHPCGRMSCPSPRCSMENEVSPPGPPFGRFAAAVLLLWDGWSAVGQWHKVCRLPSCRDATSCVTGLAVRKRIGWSNLCWITSTQHVVFGHSAFKTSVRQISILFQDTNEHHHINTSPAHRQYSRLVPG